MMATLTSPGLPAAFFKVSSKAWAAFLSSVILLAEDIEPVLSSASASSSFLIPQTTCDESHRWSRFCWPSTFVKEVATVPVPVTLRRKVPAVGVVKVGVMTMLVTSVRLNRALEVAVGLLAQLRARHVCASFDSISAVESTAACIAALAELARL